MTGGAGGTDHGADGAAADDGEFDAGLVLRKQLQITGSTLRPRSVAFKGEIAAALPFRPWESLYQHFERFFPDERLVYALGYQELTASLWGGDAFRTKLAPARTFEHDEGDFLEPFVGREAAFAVSTLAATADLAAVGNQPRIDYTGVFGAAEGTVHGRGEG